MSKARAVSYGRDYYQRGIAQLSEQVLTQKPETENAGDETRLWLTGRMKLLICRYSSGEAIASLCAAFAATMAYLSEEEAEEPGAFFDLDDFDQYYLAVSTAAWSSLAKLPAKQGRKLVTMYKRRYPEPADRDPLLDRLLIDPTQGSSARLRHKDYRPLLDAWRTRTQENAELILAAHLCQLDRRFNRLSWQRDMWSGKEVGIGLWCFASAVIVAQRGLDAEIVANLPPFPRDWHDNRAAP